MVQPVTVGLDIAKNVFHAFGADAQGRKVFSRKLRRGQVDAFFSKLEPCLIGIEACATAPLAYFCTGGYRQGESDRESTLEMANWTLPSWRPQNSAERQAACRGYNGIDICDLPLMCVMTGGNVQDPSPLPTQATLLRSA